MRLFLQVIACVGLTTAPAWTQLLHNISAQGSAVTLGLGDVNGDGSSDFAVSFIGGTVRIYSGATGQVLSQFTFPAAGTYAPLDAADLTGDGLTDLIVGTPTAPVSNAGGVLVIDLSTGTTVLTISGSQAGGTLGRSVSVSGDQSQDGVPDIIAGGLNFARLLSGTDGALLHHFTPPYASSGQFGFAVGGGGNFDLLNGLPDVIVGDPVGSLGPNPNTGVAIVFSGSIATGCPPIVQLNGKNPGDRLGHQVQIVPDLTGDIYSDALVHAQLESVNGQPGGALHLLPGPLGGTFQWSESLHSHNAGGSTFCVTQDRNSDGTLDILASGPDNVRVLSGKTGQQLSEYPMPIFGAGVSDAGDVNFDGDNEVVAVTGSNAYVYTHECGEIYNYGVGCRGSGGLIPSLTATGCLVGLGSVEVDLRNSVGPSFGAMLIGTTQVNVPLGGGCSLLVGNTLPSALTFPVIGTGSAGSGSASFPITVFPVNCAGLSIYLQAFVFDQGATPDFSATPALALQFN